ncbi:murein hydrolase transporter LrgA [Hoeflea sp. BAL378]|uniref:CidA/LrgA family protein n=1 Tax=Hoeflea sp. BAL378 TaxID=1547437 RepID=UPI00051310FC|nr:CidA/LrgA family protein [Hoeflea sp. BAL378]KGF66902.1 murein hydrolase transporter LrgA [Hoeflea sp. BAL378]
MLSALTLILSCQLAGELVTRFLGLPVPGPVAGMVILFALLVVKGSVPDQIGAVADALLRNLALLFVPAGVGVMAHLGLIGQDWLPISVAVIGSTLATIAVTALVMNRLARPGADAGGSADNG